MDKLVLSIPKLQSAVSASDQMSSKTVEVGQLAGKANSTLTTRDTWAGSLADAYKGKADQWNKDFKKQSDAVTKMRDAMRTVLSQAESLNRQALGFASAVGGVSGGGSKNILTYDPNARISATKACDNAIKQIDIQLTQLSKVSSALSGLSGFKVATDVTTYRQKLNNSKTRLNKLRQAINDYAAGAESFVSKANTAFGGISASSGATTENKEEYTGIIPKNFSLAEDYKAEQARKQAQIKFAPLPSRYEQYVARFNCDSFATGLEINGEFYQFYNPYNQSYEGDQWVTIGEPIVYNDFRAFGKLVDNVYGVFEAWSNYDSIDGDFSKNPYFSNYTGFTNPPFNGYESNKGINSNAAAALTGAMLTLETFLGTSYSNYVKIELQERGNEKRAVVQVGSSEMYMKFKEFFDNAYDTGNNASTRFMFKSTSDISTSIVLNSLYRQATGKDKKTTAPLSTTLSLTLDKQHAGSDSYGYVTGVTSEGLIVEPTIYKNDRVELTWGGLFKPKESVSFDISAPIMLPMNDVYDKALDKAQGAK